MEIIFLSVSYNLELHVVFRVSTFDFLNYHGDMHFKQAEHVHFILALVQFWMTSIANFTIQIHQILIKQKKLKIFKLLKQIDTIILNNYGIEFNNNRRFFIITGSSFILLTLFFITSYIITMSSNSLLLDFIMLLVLFFNYQFFYILLFNIHLCFEIVWRLRCLKNANAKYQDVETEFVLLILELCSNCFKHVCNFFAFEAFIILGKFCSVLFSNL